MTQKKKDTIKSLAIHAKDVGSTEIQIGLLTDKITKLSDHFKKFKINKKLMSFAKKNCIFLHCLPRGKEVDEKVFSSKKSKVWHQAFNRVHVLKSILLYCFGKLR